MFGSEENQLFILKNYLGCTYLLVILMARILKKIKKKIG